MDLSPVPGHVNSARSMAKAKSVHLVTNNVKYLDSNTHGDSPIHSNTNFFIDPRIEASNSSLNTEEIAPDINLYYQDLGMKYKDTLGKIKYVMIDIDGTLYEDNKKSATHKSPTSIRRLQDAGFKVLLVTNAHKGTPKDICECLSSLGFELKTKEVFTSIKATVMYLKKNDLRPYLMVDDSVLPYFKGISTTEPNIVIVGLYSTQLNYALLHKGLKLLMNGTPLLAFNISEVEYVNNHKRLGPGPFLQCLQYLTKAKKIDMSKPSKRFFDFALERSGFNPYECVIIGDDIFEDIAGAKKCGVPGILVKTGKYKLGDETKFPVAAVAKNFTEAATILLCATSAYRGEVYSLNPNKEEDHAIEDEEDDYTPAQTGEFKLQLEEVCGYAANLIKDTCKVTDSQIW